MIADHDRRVNPLWPYPDHDPTVRARRVAGMFRAALRSVSVTVADECDDRAKAFGETWMLDGEDLVDDDRELTTAQAAELVNVTVKTIRNWACLDHPERSGKLLPRFGHVGRETTYIAADVRAAVKVLRRSQHARTLA